MELGWSPLDVGKLTLRAAARPAGLDRQGIEIVAATAST
jgi:hypothetical protein